MFQNKNNQTTDGSQTNLSQEHDLPIEDLPVHTMKKDLEAIKNPELAKAENEYQEAASRPQPINREKLTEAQKSSPFLDFPAPKKSTPEDAELRMETAKSNISDSRIKLVDSSEKSVPKPENTIFAPEENAYQPEKHPHHIDFSKVFAGAIIALVIAIIAGGGYYFWTTRQGTQEIVVTPPVIEPEPEPASEPEPKPVAKFSTDKLNNLTIDVAAATSIAIKELLQNTVKDMADDKITSPVEFVVADLNATPVAFKDFASIMGITFSPALAANLSDTFSLFIYNDNAVARLGLVIDSNDPVKLKSLMTLEEKTLAKAVSPIFLVSDYTLANKPFASSEYKDLTIRYMNIISPEDLTVDYAIYNNKLVIGTTKMTLRSVVDYLKPQAE